MNSLRKCLTGNSVIIRLLQDKKNAINVRYLYNEQFLGLDKYSEARQRTISRLGNMKESFFNRMKSQLSSPAPSMIFTEDLKTVIHACENKPEEIEMTIDMLKKFHKQNKELRFGTFVFGPVAMRLFYFLKQQDLMLEFLKNPEMDGFFDQLKSYYLFMDLSFKSEKYSEILDAFKQLQSKQLGETRFPREALVLTAGACYKLNTPETFQLATDLVTQAREAKVTVLRKALSFVAVLALNQNKPDVALEIVSSFDRLNNITANNLRLLAFAGLGRLPDAFDILRRVTDQDAPRQSRVRGEICQETLDVLQKAVDQADDKETSHIFEQLSRSLKESNSVTSQTIDELICLPIEPRVFPRDGDNFPFRQKGRFPESGFGDRDRSFSRDGPNDEFQPRRRRFGGLAEE